MKQPETLVILPQETKYKALYRKHRHDISRVCPGNKELFYYSGAGGKTAELKQLLVTNKYKNVLGGFMLSNVKLRLVHIIRSLLPKVKIIMYSPGKKNIILDDRHGKVSIVMLTFNQLGDTQRCIESLYKNTDLSFELIIVDNGSRDGTRQYLKRVF